MLSLLFQVKLNHMRFIGIAKTLNTPNRLHSMESKYLLNFNSSVIFSMWLNNNNEKKKKKKRATSAIQSVEHKQRIHIDTFCT